MSSKEILDIVALVQDHPLTRLSGDDYGPLIQKIKERFSTNEQQFFVANFYCYLNYNTSKEFVIELDKVWSWLGFGRVNDAARLLTNNFTENEDYKIEKAATANGKAGLNLSKEGKNLGGSGLNKEIIKLTVRCFKKLCLKAKTKKSNEIHDYYINLEEVMNETVSEQAHNLRLKLKLKDEENESTIINNFSNKPVVYLIQVEENVIRFGFSNDIQRRLYEHRSEFGKDIIIKTVFETIYNREFEQMIKINFKKHIIKKKFKTIQTELIQLTDKFTYQHLKIEIEKLKTEVSTDLVPRLMKEITELKQKLNELTTPDTIELLELRREISELKLELSKKSDTSILELKTKNAELELKLSKESLESEKLELRKQELNLKYSQHMRSKNAHLLHRIENGIEQKFCPGILCREETGEDGQWLDLSLFGKAIQNKDGLRGECKDCRNVSERSNYKKTDQKMSEDELKESKTTRSLKLRTKLTEDNQKTCSKCNELKDITEFKKNGKYITGEDKFRSDCTSCVNKSRKESRKESKN